MADELNVKAIELSDAVANVELDLAITDDLRREGLARDFVRAVQSARKDAGLAPADRAVVRVCADDALWSDLESGVDVIRRATRADVFERVAEPQQVSAPVGDATATISVVRSDVSRP